MPKHDSDSQTLISNVLDIEEVRKRQVFIVYNCMLTKELFHTLNEYTIETGIRWKMERCNGFCVFKKINK